MFFKLKKYILPLKYFFFFCYQVDIIQLLTIEALDMMWYRPESTNIFEFSGRYHIMSNASIVNNCFII